ncbi:MAG TPA: hypothetical protein VFY63_12525 [Pseudorhizobium sp.]|nr:hypothetical protein [Pseudorhizobium sp.]
MTPDKQEQVTDERLGPADNPQEVHRLAEMWTADTPLVDEALRSVAEQQSIASSAVSPSEEIAALRAEVARLTKSAAEVAAASVRIGRTEASDALEATRNRIRKEPMAAVAIAAFLGCIWGLTR